MPRACVRDGHVLDPTPPHLHDGSDEGVSKHHLQCRGRQRCKVEGAELPLQGQVHVQVTQALQRRLLRAGDADQRDATRLSAWMILQCTACVSRTCTCGARARSSSLDPLFEKSSITSPACVVPKSPCSAVQGSM